MSKPPPDRTKTAFSGHSISVAAERTGLSRDVLRVWERRYGAVELLFDLRYVTDRPTAGTASGIASLRKVWSVIPTQRPCTPGLTMLAADERAMEARSARDGVTARSRSWR